ncbi:MAG TPA: 2-oxoglutarate dehydrogenase complex dihydrolipoyllysine-residue succinyltransferase [Cytophagales bacterium]|nr:2-oxoglutarate dehydrogenase complex dihydrolipoyllysine-residue succinyltransferase [Cytophagales bacterium]
MELKVPTVGESISEVTIARWLKKDGDQVNLDEVICELESDKATFEFTAPVAGKLSTAMKEGDTASIGEVIGSIQEGAASSNNQKPKETTTTTQPESKMVSTAASGKVIEMRVPSVGESISEVTIGAWNRKSGDFVNKDEILCEIESDKATFELPADASGTLEIIAKEGDTIEIGALICKIAVSGEVSQADAASSGAAQKSSAVTTKPSGESKETYASGHASPAAAKILSEKGVSAQELKGTGVDGRITKEDAQNASVKQAAPATKPASSPAENAPSAPVGERGSRRQKMTSLRKTIARRLVAAKNETAMLTTFNEVDMKPVMDLRSKYKDKFKEKYSVGLGFMSFFTKAACTALLEFPAVNAFIDGDEIIYNDFIDISVAVSAPKGLVVPVIRNAEKLSFDQIEKAIVNLATKAKESKLTIEEMTGGTFSITNGGIFGSMLSTPILNPPQSAILGMHNIVERPVVIDGQVTVRPIMYLAMSYDHRIIDGREAVSFLVRVKQLLEDPSRLLLGV